jgi:hypothetical protein
MDNGVRVLLLAVVGCFKGGALASFEVDVFVVVVVLKPRHALLLIEFNVALPVLVARFRACLASRDKVSHRVYVRRFFSLIRGEAPIFGAYATHGRHAGI